MQQLGTALVETGLITPDQLSEAMSIQRESGRSLGRVLIDRDYITERDLVRALAHQIGMPFVDLASIDIDPRAATSISDTITKRHTVLPIGFEDGKLVVAMSDPANVFALDDVRTVTGMDIKPVVSTREDIVAAIQRFSSMADEIEALGADLAGEDDPSASLAEIKSVSEEAPIVKFVNLLISQAVNDGASDIHIEPAERDLRVRFRIDGVLHEVMRSPNSIQ